ncbi:MAG: enoyl-CoA hydratase/isomerase family protein [Burkholderiaceae bacterium]
MTEACGDWLGLQIDAPIVCLALQRPDRLNALTLGTIEALDKALASIETRRDVRALIVHSTNPKAFCAGADVSDWGSLPPADMWRVWTRVGHRVFDRLAQLPQPTLAAVEGMALGGGLELALACDLRVAGSEATFGMPETRVGAIPGWGGSRRLPRLVGPAQAKRLVFTGAAIGAAEAARIGLVQEVVPAAQALPRARALALEIAANAPDAVRLAKQLIDQGRGGLSGETIAAGLAALVDDGAEGRAAFLGKRAPCYRDA